MQENSYYAVFTFAAELPNVESMEQAAQLAAAIMQAGDRVVIRPTLGSLELIAVVGPQHEPDLDPNAAVIEASNILSLPIPPKDTTDGQ